MKLPWWHQQEPAPDNPNGFYPDPPPPPADIDLCRCPGCGKQQWTFETAEALRFIVQHGMHSVPSITPAGDTYRQLVDLVHQDAEHTIGPRT